MQIVAIFDQTRADPILPAALSHIPFSREPVEAWKADCDLALFIGELSAIPLTFLLGDGTYQTSAQTDRGPREFAELRKNALRRSKTYERETQGSKKLGPGIPTEAKTAIGCALKYAVAWDQLTGSILSESAFISLPHILEAGTDLECSINLAMQHYYKQASQILRGFLEGQVLDLVLAVEGQAFRDWIRGDYHVPPLRGKNGLLRMLTSRGIFDDSLRTRIDLAYDGLNAAIHGAESTLVHSGLFKGQHVGHVFNLVKLELWSRQISNIVELGILLMKKKTEIWFAQLHSQPRMCEVCREIALEDVEGFSFGGKDFVKRKCRNCSNESSFHTGTERKVYVVNRMSEK